MYNGKLIANNTKQIKIVKYLAIIFLCVFVAFIIFPIYWVITTSFKQAADVTQGMLIPFLDYQPSWIGWGSLGSIWGVPLWTVLVRPSRHTYACIEHSGCFTVNVPTSALAEACAVCGSKSGRDLDKFAACDLTAERGQAVCGPTVCRRC